MRKTSKVGVVAVFMTVSMIAAAGTAQAKDGFQQFDTAGTTGSYAVLTDQQVAAMSPVDQANRLNPLRTAASALAKAGTTTQAETYSNVKIDANNGAVDLYLTDLGQAAALIASAKAIDPAMDTSLVRAKQATYSLKTLHAARDLLADEAAAGRLSYQLYSAAVAPDGSSLLVKTDNPTLARQTLGDSRPNLRAPSVKAAIGGVNVVFAQGAPAKPRSWPDVKWHDSQPFIAGDVITDGITYCSTGIPAVRKSDGHNIMITAGHCFPTGTKVYTGGGTTGDYTSGAKGNYVGTVTGYYGYFDAEEIDGTSNNSDESDSSGWIPVTGYAYSYNGDYVCHDGDRSYFLGHNIPCNIQVITQDVNTYTTCDWSSCHASRGVEGWAVNGWGSAGGDSGGLVFAISSANARQARGIVSSCLGSCPDGDPDVVWTEATDILDHWALKLNPVT